MVSCGLYSFITSSVESAALSVLGNHVDVNLWPYGWNKPVSQQFVFFFSLFFLTCFQSVSQLCCSWLMLSDLFVLWLCEQAISERCLFTPVFWEAGLMPQTHSRQIDGNTAIETKWLPLAFKSNSVVETTNVLMIPNASQESVAD